MHIALAGEALIDFTSTGPLGFQGHEGGGILNTAVACARLGRPTGFITQLSTDLFGEQLLRHMQANGLDTRHVLCSAAPSTLAFVERTPTTNRYAFYRNGSADAQWAPAALPDLGADCRVLVFGSISLLQEPAGSRITELVEAEHGRGRLTVFDPNMRASLLDDPDAYRQRFFARWLRATDLLKLSDEDAALLAPGLDLDEAAVRLLAGGPQAVVMTRGAAGATLYRAGQAPLSVPAPRVTVADTIGAGDTFTAGLVVSLLNQGVTRADGLAGLPEATWRTALQFAVTAAALNCTREGADPPDRAVVEAALTSFTPDSSRGAP
jgi:fructokinase